MLKHLMFAWLCAAICGVCVCADTLKMNDGTSIEGRVIDQGTQYWIKQADGASRFIDKNDVASWVTGAPAASSIPLNGTGDAPASLGSLSSFAQVKNRADEAQTAIAAVAIWQTFIDGKPAAGDLALAQAELKHWKELVKGRAEKINGKWVWGDDLKKLKTKVAGLIHEAAEAEQSQTLVAIDKLEEALRLYPNSFEANFELGYFNLVQGVAVGRNLEKIDAGVKSLETAVQLKPDSAAALSDLAIGYNMRARYELSVVTAYQAAKLEDSKEIVQNLINAISQAPQGMRENNETVKPIMREAALLAVKYSIGDGMHEWEWVRPSEKELPKTPEDEEDDSKGPPGIFANGTGFFIASDGFILTNRHVAKHGDYLMVRQSDGTEKQAQRILIDEDQDIAVIKIPTSSPVPFVHLASYDHPPTGRQLAVFGFPLLGEFGLDSNVKMTIGIVTAWDQDQELCDVTVDAQVNPGNSGGPMVDHHGNLLAMTAMKTLAVDPRISSYGLGMSTGRLRLFFNKQKDKLPGLTLTPGDDSGPELSDEQLAATLTPATVCVLCCRGTPPTDGSQVQPAGATTP